MILAGGAFNSPQLLMLSGIGPAEHLKHHGIKTIADLPVGKNLQDHLAMWIVWARPQNTSPFRDLLISMAFMQAYLTGMGPATIPPGGIVAFHEIQPGANRPEIQFLFRSAPVHPHVWFPGIKPAYDPPMRSVFGIRPVLLHPVSHGKVLLRRAESWCSLRWCWPLMTSPLFR